MTGEIVSHTRGLPRSARKDGLKILFRNRNFDPPLALGS